MRVSHQDTSNLRPVKDIGDSVTTGIWWVCLLAVGFYAGRWYDLWYMITDIAYLNQQLQWFADSTTYAFAKNLLRIINGEY